MTKQANQNQEAKNQTTQSETKQLEPKVAPLMTETEYRIGILSRSGNVGKTTMARMLLEPRMEGVGDIIYIESLNADKVSKEGKMVRAADFEKVVQKLGESLSVIVDIGVSNLEEMMQLMTQIEGSHEDFDYLLVPVSGSSKQSEDTINTFVDLINIGFDPEKIKVVFNNVNVTKKVEEEFSDVIFALNKLGIEYNPDAVIYSSNFFPSMIKNKISLEELFATPIEEHRQRQTDLRRMKHRTEKESEELTEITKHITLQRNALSAITNLDNVYEALFTK